MIEETKLWKIWWITGIPVGWLTAVLLLLAEDAHVAGNRGLGDALDVTRFLVYFAWFRLAWRASHNVANPAWTPLAQGALATGLVLSAMF